MDATEGHDVDGAAGGIARGSSRTNVNRGKDMGSPDAL